VDSPRPSTALRLAAALVGLEALAVVALAVAELFALDSDRLSLGITNAIFFSAYGAALAFAGWGLSRVRRWSRGPIVLAQLIQLGVAYSFRGGSTTWVAIVLAVVAIAVLVVILSPSSTEALYGIRSDSTTESDDTR
jgi:peptidoglycan/LPS O-acetylase OafA/YrhL